MNYDGTTGLQVALETLLDKKLNAEAMAKLTRPYKVEAGIPEDTKLNRPEFFQLRLHIYNSEKVKLDSKMSVMTKSGKLSKRVTDKNGKLIVARTENTVKRGRQAGDLKKVFTVSTGKTISLYLENEFYAGADKVAERLEKNRSDLFKAWINENEAKQEKKLNVTAALRLRIVEALTKLT
jgi:predicted DNA-binding ribbon-helix-helix protein